ncbi:hypothetical protein C7447_10379 [Tenacibaculum adriaticum]|uniref:Uncharacterized protein n=1 Tax=Tenacibaculum adriaticum TaxID=413713 RepID=A0A5S5DPQ1_9FLAO|nr:hypothetical protein C7447_10379 [Tenacibaculum adriaticum]
MNVLVIVKDVKQEVVTIVHAKTAPVITVIAKQ